MNSRLWAGILIPLSLALLSACNVVPPPQSDATRYYLLSAPQLSPGAEKSAPDGIRVGLRSVELADYLRTRRIIVRRGSNELSLEDFNRWAEPLDAGIARVLRTSLIAEPGVARVLVPPFPLEGERDFDVAVTVLRCEGSATGSGRGTAHFSALVEISSGGPNPRVVSRFNFSAPDRPWDGRDFGQLAADLSEAVAGLAREISAALQAHPAA